MARGRLASIALGFVGSVVACGPGAVTRQAAQPPTLPGSECSATQPSLRPLVVDWPSADRLALEAQVGAGTVVVHYAGCSLEVLRQCRAPGAYRFAAATRQQDKVTIHNSDELHASVPVSALKLEAALQRAGSLDADMAIVGAWIGTIPDVHASMLEGDRAGATHVVSALTVGAFTFGTAASAAASGSASFAFASAGGRSESMKDVLSRAGDPQACAASHSDMTTPPDGCGAVVRLDLKPLSGLSGAGATRCKIELGPNKCVHLPTLPATFDDADKFADTQPARCQERGQDWYSFCGSGEPVVARFFRNGRVDHEYTAGGAPTRCQVTLRDCPRNPALVGPINDVFESAATDEVRCQQRAEEYWSYCGGGQPVTASFLAGETVRAERTASHPSRCQVVLPECPRAPDAAGILNDSFDGADGNAARCVKRAKEFVDYCATSKPVTARYLEGSTVVKEERATPAGTRCQIELPDCPRKPEIAGLFNDDSEHSDADPSRCMQRASEWWGWCGTGMNVTARFFRADAVVQEKKAGTPTRCQVTLASCPAHADLVGPLNDTYDKAEVDAERCAKRAGEYAAYCGGGAAVARFFRGAAMEKEQRSP
jgi:hypothetical protein